MPWKSHVGCEIFKKVKTAASTPQPPTKAATS